jgi:long-chain acyl-CoA synthetase
VPDNLREVQPTAFLAVPRVWEKFYSGVTIALKDATPLQNWMYRRALALAYRMTEYKLQGDAPPLCIAARQSGRLLAGVPQYPPHAGPGSLPAGFTGCGADRAGPDPLVSRARHRHARSLRPDRELRRRHRDAAGPGQARSVGKAAPWGEVMVSRKGEILIKGDFLFMGTSTSRKRTAETIDAKGWLHTGDVGSIDNEGFVKITDRMKDIIITSGGKNITPSEIENQLKFSPYISDTVVIGDKRPFLTCLS